jgi:hypothetical protein
VAIDLRDDAVSRVVDERLSDPGPPDLLTIAAVIAASGDITQYQLNSKTTRQCVASLAELGQIAMFEDDKLIEENSDTRFSARVYVTNRGHTIWHPSHFVSPAPGVAISCLLNNHTYLVAQVAALASIARWAGERVKMRVAIPTALQPLVQRAVLRLGQLYAGPRVATYRSGIARVRIEPMLETLQAIEDAL